MMNQVVRWVDAACHERLPQGGDHWSLYLDIGANRSVRIDITPSYVVPSTSIPGGSKANMVVSLLEDAFSRPTEKVVKLDVPNGSTVRELVNLLIQHGRHKYEFNAQGQGCRYWTDHQLALFDQHGLLVNRAHIEAAKAAILTQWPDQMSCPLVQEDYYQ
ncbi:uncharacterized protein KD926_005625 [Aspergillus affinis]|uniref:uncharacterized protein n=1 Tax=Aspergillus affinis TaxID=1070780 RepID=UPI0022FE276A|nr:uncharacterized protein KD926_005625 [Aspergillus affinis]KAI9042330.1 hypothetical protein KD926_005625 [Aspergillus affinis]